MNSNWLTCHVEATRGDKRHVSQAADPTGVIMASKSIDDGVIENDDVDVSLVCRQIRGYRYRSAMTTDRKQTKSSMNFEKRKKEKKNKIAKR